MLRTNEWQVERPDRRKMFRQFFKLKILDEKQKVFKRRKLLTKNKLEFKSKTSNKEFDPGSG